jgi:hypothetical protein
MAIKHILKDQIKVKYSITVTAEKPTHAAFEKMLAEIVIMAGANYAEIRDVKLKTKIVEKKKKNAKK